MRLQLNVSEVKKETKFGTTSTLLGIFLVVMLACAAAFPPQHLIQQLQETRSSDTVSLEYLKNLVRSYPNYDEYRLLYVNQLYLSREFHKAKINLLPILLHKTHNETYWIGKWYDYLINERITHELPKNSAKAKKAKENLIKELTAFKKAKLSPSVFLNLTISAIDLKQRELALDFLNISYKNSRGLRIEEMSRAADYARWVNDYQLSADFYFAMKNRVLQQSLERKYFLLGVKTLRSGNLLDEALIAAEKNIHGVEDDQDVLQYLAQLALAANKPKIAQHYIDKALALKKT